MPGRGRGGQADGTCRGQVAQDRAGRQEAKTGRYGTGRRWRVRYLDPDGTERNRSFDRKADAVRS